MRTLTRRCPVSHTRFAVLLQHIEPITISLEFDTNTACVPAQYNMASPTPPITLPRSTGYLKQHRVVCCAPYTHYPFTWSRTHELGYNTLHELDLPEHPGFDNFKPVADADCDTKLLWYIEKYLKRAWRRKKDWWPLAFWYVEVIALTGELGNSSVSIKEITIDSSRLEKSKNPA
jgi:hypothetical protein